jgi:hypothetical protein
MVPPRAPRIALVPEGHCRVTDQIGQRGDGLQLQGTVTVVQSRKIAHSARIASLLGGPRELGSYRHEPGRRGQLPTRPTYVRAYAVKPPRIQDNPQTKFSTE